MRARRFSASNEIKPDFLLSPWSELDGQRFVTSDHKAVNPPRSLVWIEGDAAGVLEQHLEHVPRLEAGERCTNAEVDVTTERHVAARPAQHDLIGVFEHGGIPVGGAPEQEDR